MKIFSTRREHYWRDMATRAMLIIISVAFIVWALPRNETKLFRYDVGKPWMYGSIIAKYDFPIYKTAQALQSEKDSLTRLYQPYYNYDASMEREQIARFKSDFQDGIPGLPKAYVQLIADRLHHFYQVGIMNTPEYNNLYRDTTTVLRVVTDKTAMGIRIGELYSTIGVYEQLFLDEKLAPQRQLLQRCNLNNYIEPNLTYAKEKNETELNDLLSSVPQASGMVLSGQKVIDRGDIVDEHTFRVLASLEKEMILRNANSKQFHTIIAGQVIYVLLLVFLFTLYLSLFRRDYFDKPRSILMLYTMVVVFPVLVSLMMRNTLFSVYIVPFAMAPIFIRVFMDTRTAFITHSTMVLICAAAVKYQYEFIIIQLVAGLVAIYSLRELSQRAQLFKTALFVTLSSIVVFFALQLMQNNEFAAFDRSMNIHFIVNGIFLLLAYPLMYLIEKIFGFISNVTLFELSNTNKGLLRNLSEIAPGTFQHSITVGNLAAEIANRIGANSLLVRTGALYHDIGKMTNPVFFTENQSGVNPHDQISCRESAQIIISHVTEGLRIAEKADLPNLIKDFIKTHHGMGMCRFFYVKQQNEHPDEVVSKEGFTYPGPNPFTREQAILMMADGVEAASRSLNEYTEENLMQLIDKLVDGQVAAGYFTDCPITFRDITLAKQVLLERLKSIYHTRIQYPELRRPTQAATAARQAHEEKLEERAAAKEEMVEL